MNDVAHLFIKKITKIPTLPVVAQEIINLTSDDLISIEKLESVIENDPSISARILSVSNSVFFGTEIPNTSINNAIVRIGFNNIKNIAIGIALFTLLIKRNTSSPLSNSRLFKHSVAVGLISKMLADFLDFHGRDETFLCGMLHDIGLLFMNSYMADTYYPVIHELKDEKLLCDAEKKVLGYTHSDIGFWLANQWKLPDNVKNSVYFHHRPELTKDKAVLIVHIADYLSSINSYSAFERTEKYKINNNALELLKLSINDIKEIEKKIDRDIFSNRVFLYD